MKKLIISIILLLSIQLSAFEECDFVIKTEYITDKQVINRKNYIVIFKQVYSSQEYKTFKNKKLMNRWIKRNLKRNRDIEFYYSWIVEETNDYKISYNGE